MTEGTWQTKLALGTQPGGAIDRTADDHWYWFEVLDRSERPPGEERNEGIVRFAWDGTLSEPFELIQQRDKSLFVRPPNESHLAYFGRRGTGFFIGVDGEQRGYEGFSRSVRPTFSEDGAHLAYGAQIADAWRLIVDGSPLGTWNAAPLPPVYSADGNRLAFAAENYKIAQGKPSGDYRQWIVLDGVDEPSLGMIISDPGGMQFSPDGRRFAYGSILGQVVRMVVDGVVGPEHEGIASPRFSPDSQRFVYIGGRKKAVRLMGEGVSATPEFEVIATPLFSPDSARLAYAGIRSKGRMVVVTDGEAGPEFADLWGTLAFSPDSRRVAYLALRQKQGFFGRGTWGAVVDGALGGEWDEVTSDPHFSPDSRHLAFSARRGKESFMVVDGAPGAAFKQVGPPRYGADGRLWHLVERATESSPFAILADGNVVVEFDEGSEIGTGESFLLSEDGQHMAAAVRMGDEWHPVVDGSVGPGFPAVGSVRFEDHAVTFAGLRPDGIHLITFSLVPAR